MTRRILSAGAICLAIVLNSMVLSATDAWAHCQVPCGIYDDEARFATMSEHVTTIEKSMNQISELSAKVSENMNQLTRWVDNKETHADELAEIVSYYFLAQRIKAPADDSPEARDSYLGKLELLHKMTVSSMKCKQTTDLQYVSDLRQLIDQFHTLYFEK